MKTMTESQRQQKQAIDLGFTICRRINRHVYNRSESHIEACLVSVLEYSLKRKRLLSQFNACQCNNVKARLNRRLTELDSLILSLEARAIEIESQMNYGVKTPKNAFNVVKRSKRNGKKKVSVNRLIETREQIAPKTRFVTGTAKGFNIVPSYVSGIAPRSYKWSELTEWTPAQKGMTGHNEIYPKTSA